MLATLAHHTTYIGRKLMLTAALSALGLAVGFSCALLPPSVPMGIVAVVALFLLWVLPDLQLLPEGWTRTMIFPFAFCMICVPTYYALILPGLPQISIRRAAQFLLVIPFAIVLAASYSRRAYASTVLSHNKWLKTCIIGFLFMVALSTVFAISPTSALSADAGNLTAFWLPMLAIAMYVRSEKQIVTFFKLCIVCVFINLIVGSIESYLHRPFLIWLLPTYMRDQIFASNPLAQAALTQGQGMRGGSYRAISTFSTALSWGEMSAMLMPPCLHFIAYARSFAGRLFGYLGAIACLLSVVLSGSRGAYVGMIGATVSYVIIWSIRALRTDPGSLTGKIWLTFYGMASCATLGSILFVGRIHRVVLGGSESQGSTDSRYAEWALAEPRILARPLWGYGNSSAAGVIGYTGINSGPDASVTVDGYFMNLLVDFGVPGFIFFCGIFFVAIFICFKLYVRSDVPAAPLGASIGTSLIAFVLYRITLSQIESLPIAFSLIGLTLAYSQMVRRQSLEPTLSRSRPNLEASLQHR